MFHSFFQFSSKVDVLIPLFTFFQFYSVVSRDSKVDNFEDFLFCCWLLKGLVFWPRLGDPFAYQSPIGVCACHFLGHLHWSLKDIKSSQISRTLQSILSDLNTGVIWRGSIRPPISNSFWLFGAIPSAQIAIRITVTIMFLSFVGSLAKS